ncbi:MAG: cobalt-precorrin-5B (C(1))-methyltransferase [Nitrospirae bacterium]|nr:cobalt-precorrin-5B (C(1))-methyltransferase [Nitrospirota bacterium]
MKKKLRSGYTTGACAAAAAKAAVTLLLQNTEDRVQNTDIGKKEDSLGSGLRVPGSEVEIPFPDGSRVKFRVKGQGVRDKGRNALAAWASVVKDAGDDPDVTNGAEIVAEARIARKCRSEEVTVVAIHELPLRIDIKGGKGVGMVTKPGLPVPVGEPAINPVPKKMITEAVMEAIEDSYKLQVKSDKFKDPTPYTLYATRCTMEITIFVPNGEELAKKTLNSRLGIDGGISILGTTGIVKPVSSEAWTATITSSMDVARAAGRKEVVLSAGRTSEKAHMKKFNFPEESYVLMGDYLEFSLREAKKHGFKRIHLCAQWAKMVKIAMATPQTHVRFGAIDIKKAVEFLNSNGIIMPVREFNTAREIFDFILLKRDVGAIHELPLQKVCNAARQYAKEIAEGVYVITYLVSYDGEIIAGSE